MESLCETCGTVLVDGACVLACDVAGCTATCAEVVRKSPSMYVCAAHLDRQPNDGTTDIR